MVVTNSVDGDQQRSHSHGQCSAGSAVDHHAAGQPDRDGGSDGYVLGDGNRNRAAELSVAEERRSHQRGDFFELHDAGDDDSDNGALFTVVVSNSAGSVTSNAATLTVNPAPVAPSITTQPANQTVTAGQTATFSVTATGTAPLSYQWQKNGTAISGAASSSYTTPATTSSDNGALFTVVVTNSVGSVTSNTATLTVNPAPVAPSITTQPASQTVTAGQTATFSVTATGTAPLELSVAEERHGHQRGNSRRATRPPATTRPRQRRTVHCGRDQHRGQCDQQRGHSDRQPSAGGTVDHHAAGEPDCDGRTDSDVLGGSDGNGSAQLSVAEERHGHQRRDSSSYTTPATTSSDNGALSPWS